MALTISSGCSEMPQVFQELSERLLPAPQCAERHGLERPAGTAKKSEDHVPRTHKHAAYLPTSLNAGHGRAVLLIVTDRSTRHRQGADLGEGIISWPEGPMYCSQPPLPSAQTSCSPMQQYQPSYQTSHLHLTVVA